MKALFEADAIDGIDTARTDSQIEGKEAKELLENQEQNNTRWHSKII